MHRTQSAVYYSSSPPQSLSLSLSLAVRRDVLVVTTTHSHMYELYVNVMCSIFYKSAPRQAEMRALFI